jgi:hypothetical protein
MKMLTMQVKEEMKRDVKEITRIAIEDGIAANEIDNLYSHIHHNQTLESIKQRLDYKIVVSDIIGRNIVSKRFADKVMSLFPKYQKEELKLIMNCTKLVYYDPYFAGEIYSNQKQHNMSVEAEPA